ncbi:hypothetical protein BDN72DRAFT_959748 [Pluteus cervinus]|uniref:Uncharacterized protein n=1 Tax=Pluteus cervinus TaxID=181527 RepID=A0ACD3ATZ8_9AGAR|nr:hypothetical protein BDN72DRAFT_959748 [Pluteus cervinus]
MKLALAVSLLLLPFAYAFEYLVSVGKDETTGHSGIGFDPSVIYVQGVGDVIVFRFNNGTHSVVESTYENPCTSKGGYDSGVETLPPSTPVDSAESPRRTVRLNGTDPLWFYDQASGQCQRGAVFAVNPPKDKSPAQFKQNAASDPGTSRPSASATPSGSRTASSPIVATPSHPTKNSAEKIVAFGLTALVGLIVPCTMYL